MPIDPDYPIDRINFMLENSKTKILISTENFLNNIEFSETFIDINKIDFSIKNEKNLNIPIEPTHLAYIMYTSGSTGIPKAVAIKHYNVFPVDRTKVDSKSLFQALSIFENNEPNQLLIFPEGKVVKDENEIGKKARNGATFIAAKVNIPIIPAYITRRPSFFSKVNVTFGEPIFIPQEVLNDKNILRDYSRKLVDKIYSLKG